MGFGYSRTEKKALDSGKKIREDLYKRVNQAKQRYGQQFNKINEEKKKMIIQASAGEISEMLDAHQTTSVEVLLIFIERVCDVGIENNYVLDEMFEEAMHKARQCDQQREADGWKKKCWRRGLDATTTYAAFFGVPASLKETIFIKGRQTYVGTVAKTHPVPTEDSMLYLMINKMGLIPFVRTNVPPACKTIQTNNNLFGYCKNQWNRQRSCGGSSGGQGGIVGSYCSPLGIGTDIGGSLRIPAEFNGICTIKPAKRYTNLGVASAGKFCDGVPVKTEVGPLTRTVEDLILWTDFLTNPTNYESIPIHLQDPYINYKPFNHGLLKQRPQLKIGMVSKLKTIRASKPNIRALRSVKQVLVKNGHEVVELDLPDDFEGLFHFMLLAYTSDKNLSVIRDISPNEPLIPEYKLLNLLSKIPWVIKKIIIWWIKKKEPRIAKILGLTRPLSSKEMFEQIYKAQKTISQNVFSTFARNYLDAIIMPNFVTPAPRLGTIGKLQYFYSFVASWNFIKYPAGTLPITIAREDEDNYQDEFSDTYCRNVQEVLKGSAGLPVGVQFVSTPYNEEKILYLMETVEKEIQFRKSYQPPI